MNDHSELNRYMNKGIRDILANALKMSLKNQHEIAFLLRFLVSAAKARRLRIRQERFNLHVPPFLIASISSKCNLHCSGCYARENHSCCDTQTEQPLTDAEWSRIFTEAGSLGISFILLAGGEPLMRRDVLEGAAEHPNIVFPVFTNGTLINENWIDFFHQKRNLIPVFSLEGNEEETDQRRGHGVYHKITSAMSQMKESSIFFGVSITVTSDNIHRVTEFEFVRSLSESGCGVLFFVEYVPVTEDTIPLALSDAGRALMDRRLKVLRSLAGNLILLSFPGDEIYLGGCLAAGRGFFHINPVGGAEPCPFSPITACNVRDCSLTEALSSDLFRKLEHTGMLSMEHVGGCALFGKENEISQLMSG